MRFSIEKYRDLALSYWQPAVYYGMLLVFFGLLLWFRLGSLTGGFSMQEEFAAQTSASLGNITADPLNAPFTLLAYLFGLIYSGGDTLLPVRAAATVIGLITLSTFYWLVRHWHGERTAILSSIIFGCSAWFLHTARLGTPDVMLFLLLALVAFTVWFKKTSNGLVLIAGFALAAALMYIPGMLWLLAIGAAWRGKEIIRLAKKHRWYFAAGAALMLALIAPLLKTVYEQPTTGRILAGLPAEGGLSATGALDRLVHIPINLVASGPDNPMIWLGKLPILDAFSIAMLALGAYLYVRYRHLPRSKVVGVAILGGVLLIALGGAVTLSIIIPFVYILVAAGIGYMLDRWTKVFPRNTIAQAIGVALVSLAVITVSWYGLRHYFVAWPNAPETKEVFIVE